MSGRLHVAFVHDDYPDYRRRLFSVLAKRHDLDFFFVNQSPAQLPPASHSLRGYRIPEMSDLVIVPRLLAELRRRHKERPFDLFLAPDLGYSTTLTTWIAARMTRTPLVVWSGEWYSTKHPRRLLRQPLERAIARSAASCLAYGTRAAERLTKLGAAPRAIFVTGNASDYVFRRREEAELAAVRRRWGLDDSPVVAFLGRLLPFKAPDVLVRAFAGVEQRLPAHLLMAGDGPMLPALKKLAQRTRLRHITFTGRAVRGNSEKDVIFSLASVFVLPCVRWRVAEPWGLVLNEAASAALPIVTTSSVGAVGDLIRHEQSGLVVPEADEPELEAAILHLLTDRDEARRLGAAAKQAEAKFTVERMAEAFDRAFAHAIEGAA